MKAGSASLAFVVTSVAVLLGGCPLSAPTVGGNPIVCQTTQDCAAGTVCDFSQGRGICLAAPDAGDGGIDSGVDSGIDGGMDGGVPTCAPDGTRCTYDGGNVCLALQCVYGCALDAGVVLAGSLDVAGGCMACQPAQSAMSYTPLADGSACQSDGGNVCQAASCIAACVIDGGIIAARTLDPLDPGQCCNVMASATNWSSALLKGVTLNTTNPPIRIAAGDFNADGKLDLAVAESGVQLGLFYGQGNGTFGAEVLLTLLSAPVDLAVGDFNGDGFPDIAALQANAHVVILLNEAGDGGFDGSGFFDSPQSPTALIAANLYTDAGPPDLAVTGRQPPNDVVSVAQNVGGAFGSSIVPYTVGGQPDALCGGNFDFAGGMDLAVGNFKDGTLTILSNLGDGALGAAQTVVLAGAPTSVASVPGTAGKLDAIAAAVSPTADAGSVATIDLLTDGGYGITASVLVGPSPSAIVAADFNGDSLSDLAVADSSQSTLRLLFAGDGGFTVDSYSEGPGVAEAVGDFNGDGRPDLAVANGDSTVTVYLGQCP